MLATTCGDAPTPAIRLAGSPGMKYVKAKVMMEMPASTKTIQRSRRVKYRSMDPVSLVTAPARRY
jgi:hypothetical protein